MTWSPWQKLMELPDGSTRDALESLTSEYDLTEGEDKFTMLTMFQQNQLDDIRTCRILGLTALNSLLQYVNWLVWEVCSVN